MNGETKHKYDKVKPYSGVLSRFPRAILEVAKVSMYGDQKHEVPDGDKSFLDLPDGSMLFREAACRHMLGEAIKGPMNEKDFGLLHAAHEAWNALARLEIMLIEREKADD